MKSNRTAVVSKSSVPCTNCEIQYEMVGKRRPSEKRTISGEPETQVKMILNTMGDHVDEPILELTQDRLLLLDKDGKTKHDWKRVRAKQ